MLRSLGLWDSFAHVRSALQLELAQHSASWVRLRYLSLRSRSDLQCEQYCGRAGVPLRLKAAGWRRWQRILAARRNVGALPWVQRPWQSGEGPSEQVTH